MKKSLVFLAVLTTCIPLCAQMGPPSFPSGADYMTYNTTNTRYTNDVTSYNNSEGQYNNMTEMYLQLLSILPPGWPPTGLPAASWNGNQNEFNTTMEEVCYDISKMSQYLNAANVSLVDANNQLTEPNGNSTTFAADITSAQGSLSNDESWIAEATKDLNYANQCLTNLYNIYYEWYWANYPG